MSVRRESGDVKRMVQKHVKGLDTKIAELQATRDSGGRPEENVVVEEA